MKTGGFTKVSYTKKSNKLCIYWNRGHCTFQNCKYEHQEIPPVSSMRGVLVLTANIGMHLKQESFLFQSFVSSAKIFGREEESFNSFEIIKCKKENNKQKKEKYSKNKK